MKKILSAFNERCYKKYIIRTFDVVFSIIVLLVFSPVWIVISALIRFDSNGPVIFRQIRVGLNGKLFQMYKFRTMVNNAQKMGPLLTQKNDSRITFIGKLLRKTSLDEIPNFINVLKGEMSVIGPRPEVPDIACHYNSWQKKVLSVKPGITGFSQVLGRQELEIDYKSRLDRYYIKKMGLCIDMWIMFKTIFVVFEGSGTR
ncbi:MAG TPA: sugar transferase [Candidatus Wallbacteria bacterium]|nr:sugar transferase [Candidatus Wallbacteria bacterium]